MSDVVIVALVSAVVGLYGVTLPLLISTRKHAKSADSQVTNAHDTEGNPQTTNLRVDMDEKHSDNRGRLVHVENRLSGVERGVQRIEDHLGIERTRPRPPRPRTA